MASTVYWSILVILQYGKCGAVVSEGKRHPGLKNYYILNKDFDFESGIEELND